MNMPSHLKHTLGGLTMLLCVAASSFAQADKLPAAPAQGMEIAAVVGDQAVSSYDVDNRMRFIIVTANLSNTPDVAQRIRPQIIRSLIDEKLQLQEAARNDIKVTDSEIGEAIASIENDRHMPPGDITRMLDANHIPKETFAQQLRAQLAWHKLLVKKIKPQVHVSDDEIRLATQRLMMQPVVTAKAGTPQELQIAVIALPVDKPARDNEMHRLGDKLVKEIRSGASFEEVSRQFSSSTASAGGKVESFWVRPEQLDPAIAKALAAAKSGTVTEPVRTPDGYTIVKVYNTRSLNGAAPAEAPVNMQVALKEILLKLKPDAKAKEAKVLLQIAEDLAKHPGSCAEKGFAGLENTDDFDIQVNYRDALTSDLPAAIKIIADNLKVGDISTPFATDDGIVLYMLCDKKNADAPLPPDRNRVRDMLMLTRLNLEAQKYLRNLRRDTFIEIR